MSERFDHQPVNLDQFHATSDGDRDFEHELVSIFLDDAGRRCNLLIDALNEGKAEQAAYEAHTIKGASANVGAEEMRRLAERLEKFARAGDLTTAEIDSRKLFDEFQRVKAYLERYLADQLES